MFGLSLCIASGSTRQHRASWSAKGASLHMDFAGGRAAMAGKVRPFADLIDCGRASAAFDVDSKEYLHEFAPYQPRITDRGLLVHGAKTNHWASNWQALIAYDRHGIKSEIVGSGTIDGFDYVDVRVHGTNNSGSNQWPNIRLGNVAAVSLPVVAGEKITSSVYVALLDDTAMGSQKVSFFMRENNGAAVVHMANAPLDGLTDKLVRHSFTYEIKSGDTINDPHFFQTVPAGETINYTLRLAVPQFEKAAFASPPNPATGTVAADSILLKPAALEQIGSVGTWFIDFDTPANWVAGRHAALGGDWGANKHFVAYTNDDDVIRVHDGSATLNLGALANSQAVKFAIANDATGIRVSLNGGAVVSRSGMNVFTDRTNIVLGNLSPFAGYHLDAPIRELIYWPYALSNEQLLGRTQ